LARRVYPRRYSQAVFEIALERKELDKWQSDLKRIAGLSEEAGLISLLQSPKLHFDNKTKLLSELLDDINPLALNLVYLLVTRGNLSMIGDIVEGYQQLLDRYRGIEQARVTTVIPLDDEDKLRLGEQLGAIVGKKVIIKPEVDSGLIGGVVARVGGKLIDGSTRSKLEALKRELVGGGTGDEVDKGVD